MERECVGKKKIDDRKKVKKTNNRYICVVKLQVKIE